MLFSFAHLLPLELLLNNILNTYLASSDCITFFLDTPISFQSPVPYMYVIPDALNLVEQVLNVSDIGCSDYVVVMKEPQKFLIAFDKVVHIGIVRRSNRKIIILPHKENVNDVNLPSKVFAMKGSDYVADMLMIAYYETGEDCTTFDLITHKFVGADEEVNEPLYFDRWNSCTEEFDNRVNLFPFDMTNMQGKTLRASGFTYKPYILLDLDPDIEPLGEDGIEIRLIHEFCRWINCTIQLVRQDEDQWGSVYENETAGIGILGSIIEDRADLGLNGMYPWYDEWRLMDFSSAVLRSAVTGVAPAPRLLSSWQMPLMPFTWYSWLAVILTFFYASIGLIVAEGFSANSHPFFTVFGMLVAQDAQSSSESANWKIRSVIGWLLIVGLILGSAYGAGLASTFTVPRYEPSIDTMKDMVDRNMEWGGTHIAWTYSLTTSTDPVVIQLVKQFRTLEFEELERKSYTRSMAYGLERLPAGTYAIGEYVTEEAMLDLMLLVENFYCELTVIMLRKSSPYTDKLSAFIGRLHQSGLLLAWESQVVLKYMNYKVQQEVRLSRSKSDDITKPLSLNNVVGVFIMYGTGIAVSTIIFVLELIVHHRKKKII